MPRPLLVLFFVVGWLPLVATAQAPWQQKAVPELQQTLPVVKKTLIATTAASCPDTKHFERQLAELSIHAVLSDQYNTERLELSQPTTDETCSDYPRLAVLDERGKVIETLTGIWSDEEFLLLLRYYASDAHLHLPWEDYREAFLQSSH